MADPDRRSRTIALPIGPNGSLVNGTLLINKNGDAEWFQGVGLGQQSTPTFTSNRTKGYTWQPSPNCVNGVTCPTADLKTRFYSNTVSTSNLNNARLETFNSSTGFNSPQLANEINVPGSNTASLSEAPGTTPTPAGTTPTPAGTTPTPEGTTPTPSDINIEDPFSGAAIPEIGQDTSYNTDKKRDLASKGLSGLLRYPLKIKDDQDRIVFKRFEYTPKKLNPNSEDTYAQGKPISTIILPIQSGISDTNSVEWGGANMNPIEMFAARTAFNAMDTDQQFSEVGQEAMQKAYSTLKSNDMWKYYFAQEAVGVQGLLSRASGSVLNPNLSLLFNGPSLRPFSFTFRLSPRSKDESIMVKRIIRQFKEGSAVNKSTSNLFLKAPDVFKIEYVGNSSSSLNKFKTCALTTVSVNYTPDGTYMTYSDGTMTSYELTLTFNELDPIYQQDYRDIPPDSIGY